MEEGTTHIIGGRVGSQSTPILVPVMQETSGNALPIISPIPSLNSTFHEWDATEDGYRHFFSLVSLVFEGWSTIGYH